jgi:very-short-patch-repair endonuclease
MVGGKMTTPAAELRRLTLQAAREKWELWFLRDIRAAGIPMPYVSHPEKDAPARFQYIVPDDEFLSNKPFDFAWPDLRILVEIDGGTWMTTGYGRSAGHAHPERIEEDNRKRNWARVLGYTVLQFTGGQVEGGDAVSLVEAAIEMRKSVCEKA